MVTLSFHHRKMCFAYTVKTSWASSRPTCLAQDSTCMTLVSRSRILKTYLRGSCQNSALSRRLSTIQTSLQKNRVRSAWHCTTWPKRIKLCSVSLRTCSQSSTQRGGATRSTSLDASKRPLHAISSLFAQSTKVRKPPRTTFASAMASAKPMTLILTLELLSMRWFHLPSPYQQLARSA